MNKHLLPNLQLGNNLGEEGRGRREGGGGRGEGGGGRGGGGRGRGGSRKYSTTHLCCIKILGGYCAHKCRRLTCNALMGGGMDMSLHSCNLARIYTFLVNHLPFLPHPHLQQEQKQIKIVLPVITFLRCEQECSLDKKRKISKRPA